MYAFRYTDKDSVGTVLDSAEDAIDLAISYLRLPASLPVEAGVYQRGRPVLLEAEFEAFPTPKADDVAWEVTSVGGQTTKIRPGEISRHQMRSVA